MEKESPGFDRNDAVVKQVWKVVVSSPVRIVRDSDLLSNIEGIYPCGEGAGYAGGITSAAMDGIKIAEVFLKNTEIFRGEYTSFRFYARI